MKKWRFFYVALFAVLCSCIIAFGSSVNSFVSSSNAFYVDKGYDLSHTFTEYEFNSQPSNMFGNGVWSYDGVYYYGSSYVLDSSTDTWESITWNISGISASYMVNYNGVLYLFPYGGTSYYLDDSTMTWQDAGISNIPTSYGSKAWVLGDYMFWNLDYVYDSSTNSFVSFTFNNAPANFNASSSEVGPGCIWQYNGRVFYNDTYGSGTSMELNLDTFTWYDVEWIYNGSLSGSNIPPLINGKRIRFIGDYILSFGWFNDVNYALSYNVNTMTVSDFDYTGIPAEHVEGLYMWNYNDSLVYTAGTYTNNSSYAISYTDIVENVSPIGAMVDLISLLTAGIGSLSVGIGSGLSELASDIFVSNGSLSVFGALIVIFAGVSLALCLSRWMVNFVCSLGKRNR